jgi:hypothetical protein
MSGFVSICLEPEIRAHQNTILFNDYEESPGKHLI